MSLDRWYAGFVLALMAIIVALLVSLPARAHFCYHDGSAFCAYA